MKYTVTWKDTGGNVIRTDEDVPYGTKAVLESVDNMPEETRLYWSDGNKTYSVQDMPQVKSDVTYTAVFKETKN